MKLGLLLDYAQDFLAVAGQIGDLESAGLDQVWVPEPYGFDAVSQVGYLAARTSRLEIGTSIINTFSRTPALVAMTAAGCDYVSSGRFNLGLGASGPQVIEGFHGMPYDKPLQRIREYVESCRMIWRREPYRFSGRTVMAPLQPGAGTGLGIATKLIHHPVRPDIPIWWASLKGRSVTATAELADGWLPTMFLPEQMEAIWGRQLHDGLQLRSPELGRLQIAAGGVLRIDDQLRGDQQLEALAPARRSAALYVGGMGARHKNFYNELFGEYGYAREAAQIQDAFLAGRRAEAARAVPSDWLMRTNLVGPAGFVAERVAAYRAAGVTTLLIMASGGDMVAQVQALRAILDR